MGHSGSTYINIRLVASTLRPKIFYTDQHSSLFKLGFVNKDHIVFNMLTPAVNVSNSFLPQMRRQSKLFRPWHAFEATSNIREKGVISNPAKLRPYSQTLDLAGKACQGQMLQPLWSLLQGRKKI